MRAVSVLVLFAVSRVVGLAEPSIAIGPPPSVSRPSAAINPLLTQAQVDLWIAKWQKRLDLRDWRIESKIVRVYELPESAVANIHWSIPNKQATIRVLNSADSSLRKTEILKDTELSVVHELVHLSMSKLPLDPNHTELEEEAVKKLSTALLALDDTKK